MPLLRHNVKDITSTDSIRFIFLGPSSSIDRNQCNLNRWTEVGLVPTQLFTSSQLNKR